jgi:hypothetical protein
VTTLVQPSTYPIKEDSDDLNIRHFWSRYGRRLFFTIVSSTPSIDSVSATTFDGPSKFDSSWHNYLESTPMWFRFSDKFVKEQFKDLVAVMFTY